MKKLKITVLSVFATVTLYAQDIKGQEVPSEVNTTFSQSYSNATDVEWEKSGDFFKVEFEINNMDHDIWYDGNGKMVKSKIEISEKDLPGNIVSAVKNKYADYKIDSIEVHEENSVTTYEVEIEKAWSDERTLMIDSSGNILSDVED